MVLRFTAVLLLYICGYLYLGFAYAVSSSENDPTDAPIKDYSMKPFKPVKGLKPFNQSRPASVYDNPNFIRDRFKDEIWKPTMNASWVNRFRKPFHPAWMDYCDPYHCNDYHKIACGLNRRKMRFKWFQSGCHIILNNVCSRYRGTLRYDMIETKFCALYVMYLRAGCPSSCAGEMEPVCAVSTVDNHAVLFRNECAYNSANCRSESFQEYEEVDMGLCVYYL